MPPTMVTGTRGSTVTNTSVQKRDVKDKILLLEPNAAPITLITAKLSSVASIHPKFEWIEDVLVPDSDAINYASGYSAGDTSVVVDNGSYFTIGDIVKVPRTGEVIQVTNVSTNTLTITRSIGGTAAGTLVNNEPLFIIGNAFAQGGSLRGAKSTQKTMPYNYCQIIKRTIAITRSYMNYGLYGEDDQKYQRRKEAIQFKKDIERTFLWGEKAVDTSGTHPQYYTGGIFETISTNATADSDNAMAESELFGAFIRSVFQYGNSKKFLFCAPIFASAIDSWARSKLHIIPSEKTFGIAANRMLTSFGELVIIPHWQLEGAVYGGDALVLDMDCLSYRYLQGRDMTLELDVVKDGTDAQTDQYIAEVGLQMEEELRHGVYTGVTSFT